VIEDRTADNAAADHQNACMGFHRCFSLFIASDLTRAKVSGMPRCDIFCRILCAQGNDAIFPG
jgi:hypothetical protein